MAQVKPVVYKRVEVFCSCCGRQAMILQSRARIRDRRCDECRGVGFHKGTRRTYTEQVNPKTDLQWQPRPHDPRRPPVALLKEQRRRAELGLSLMGYKIVTEDTDD